jgi:RNA polymerase sigma-70 factor (ECF subfamily)
LGCKWQILSNPDRIKLLTAVEQKPLQETEATLLLRQGEEQGLRYFYQQYDTALQYFALRIIGDNGAAEDIVADCFIKLWENRATLHQPSSVNPYLYRMVRNASIDFLRRKKREAAYRKEIIYRNEVSEEALLFLEIETQTHHLMYQAIENLPNRMGLVFRMFYFQRKSLRQIADELQVSIETVSKQKSQALLRLRKTLTFFIWIAGSFLSLLAK